MNPIATAPAAPPSPAIWSTAPASPPPVLLHHLLDSAALRWPDHPALTDTEGTVTYRQLAALSTRVAARLRAAGGGRGDRIAVSTASGRLAAALAWGAGRAGMVFALLHEQVTGAPMAHILADFQPMFAVCDTARNTELATAAGVRTLTPQDLLADRARAALAPEPALSVDPACMIYTSGSTAAPKAVVSTHAQMLFAASAIQSALRYTDDDTVFCPLPLSFDYGLYQLFLAAQAGAHVWLGRPADVGPTLLHSLRRSRATVLAAVPAVAQALDRMLARSPGALPPLRLLTNTGAAMPPSVLAGLRSRLPGLRVQLMFGLTECKRTTIMPPDGDLERPGSCGLPLAGTEVLIVGDDGAVLPPGEIGQIVVRGPHVMAGYWRRPELTAERFPRAEGLFPQLRTGDYGWRDEAGYLYFVGRRDDIYKERGFRVSATEVEAAAARVPGVEAAAVLPPSGDTPSILFAATALSTAHLLDGLREQLEEFKIPHRCVIVERLPLSGNGKVDKKALRAALAQERADA
jgi:acyl-CoA synthetase (AMP-forming)/AMP-acid ligase II